MLEKEGIQSTAEMASRKRRAEEAEEEALAKRGRYIAYGENESGPGDEESKLERKEQEEEEEERPEQEEEEEEEEDEESRQDRMIRDRGIAVDKKYLVEARPFLPTATPLVSNVEVRRALPYFDRDLVASLIKAQSIKQEGKSWASDGRGILGDSLPMLMAVADLEQLARPTAAAAAGNNSRVWRATDQPFDRRHPLREPLLLYYAYLPESNSGAFALEEGNHRLQALKAMGVAVAPVALHAQVLSHLGRASNGTNAGNRANLDTLVATTRWWRAPSKFSDELASKHGYIPSRGMILSDIGLPTVAIPTTGIVGDDSSSSSSTGADAGEPGSSALAGDEDTEEYDDEEEEDEDYEPNDDDEGDEGDQGDEVDAPDEGDEGDEGDQGEED